ncbi:tyrosine-protein phosphatase [Pseudomonas fluorescens]|uniref:Tyrosine-protein phosphatase n=1 Tax=Pseudomonas fluorescens TaxID=294 RepID=A0A5E7UYZ6_PSEFL|nr:tyrosine-protein phosphatase [Pseudomonas fluorescens]VVQ15600.1 hypothetical protein PS928_04282 [Pseudomonas fluorescens]
MRSTENTAEVSTLQPLRRVSLVGAINFRDLGGYSAGEGRTIKWGQLFRSDSLAELSDDDLLRVAPLQLRSIFDLRHLHERNEKPNRLDAAWSVKTHAIGFYPHGAEDLMVRVKNREVSLAAVHEIFRLMYGRLPVDQAATYGQMLQQLVAPNALPALIHCTSGKDRTGFAAAVVMLALGVTRESIMHDYMLSNQSPRDLTFMVGEGADPDVVSAVQRVTPDYLEAAFEAIDATYGSDLDYLRQGLGFSTDQRQHLQRLLLE